MTPLERADRARVLLQDEVLAEAFADIREQLVQKLEASPFGDVETQHELALSLQVLKRLREQLMRYTDEIAIDKQKQRHESWVKQLRRRILP